MPKAKDPEAKSAKMRGNKNSVGNRGGGTHNPAHKFTTEERQKAAISSHVSRTVHKLVESTMLEYLRDALTKPDKKGHKFYEDFIDSFLKEAKSNPNGQAARMLGSGLFSESTLSKLDAQTTKMMAKDIEFHRFRIRETLFDKQQELFDNRKDPEEMVICSRRSGKTEFGARKIVDFCLIPNTPVAYFNLTFSNAIAQMYDKVLEVANNVDLGTMPGTSKSAGKIVFSNGSSVDFYGNSNNAEAEKVRGFKYRLALVDEIGAQRNLKYLINDVLSPLLKDFADSQIIYTGTPPRNKVHYSHTLWNMPGIKKYHWTLLDNPYIPNRENIIKNECAKRGITEDDPFIRREYMGEMEAFDTEAQVYRNYKTYTEFQPGFVPDRIYVGVDFGFNDFNAVVPLLVDSVKKVAYTYNVKKFNKASVSDIANAVIKCRDDAIAKALELNRAFDMSKVQIITDTNEKSVSYELATTYNIRNVYCAYKYDKQEGISQLAEWLRNGTFYVEEGGDLAFECENTMYKRDDSDNILGEIDDNLYHPDAMDALLYVSRQFAFDVMRFTQGDSKLLK